MKRITIITLFNLFFVALFSTSAAWAEQHPVVNVDHLSGPFGTGTYVLGSALEDISKKYHPWLRISNSESPGFAYLVKKLTLEKALRKTMFIANSKDTIALAQQGLSPFDQKYDVQLRLLGVYCINPGWLVTFDPKIKSIEDLKGKKVAFGRKPQAAWAIVPEAVLRDGWNMRDKVTVEYLGTEPAAQALLDGLVDAAVAGGYINPITKEIQLSPQTIELMASGRKIYHIPWGKEEVLKTIQKGMLIIPVTIPSGILQGLDKDMPTFAIDNSWYAAPEFPDELAYELVKMIVKNISRFKEYHGLGKLISPELLIYGSREKDIHPGALRAYKELGVIK
jgi:TRAP transporter TAXI family solute receptor